MSVAPGVGSDGDDSLAPYRQAVAEGAEGFDATLWASPATQRLRFEVFAGMLDLCGKHVLDAGCGPGDLAEYLAESGCAHTQYTGVDGLEASIEAARARGVPRSRFVLADFVVDPEVLSAQGAQVVVISGTLNTMDPAEALRVLEAAWAGAGEGLAFNFLSDRAVDPAPTQLAPARRLPTLDLLQWALGKTPHVRFRHDYFAGGHDATISMRRPDPAV
ncbi:MAG: class I SAM-dependent methyltransferase [Planctomycetota bacterium]